MSIEHIYDRGIKKPLRWIAAAVLHPARFHISYEPASSRQRASMLAWLAVPLFLIALLLVILIRLLPIPIHMLVWSVDAEHVPERYMLVIPPVGVALGLLLGFLSGLMRGVGFGIFISLTAGVVFGVPGVYGMLHTELLGAWLVPLFGLAAGLALGLSFGLSWGLAFGVVVGLAAAVGIAGPDLAADFVIGLGFSLALPARESIVARLEVSLVLGIVLGVIGGLSAGLLGGLASGLLAGLGSLLGLYQVALSEARMPAQP